MNYFVWAKVDGNWSLVAITRSQLDAKAVHDRYTDSYIALDLEVVEFNLLIFLTKLSDD